jgi:hypothetical protein
MPVLSRAVNALGRLAASAALWLVAALAPSCQSLVASPAEYGAYRAVRVAPTLPEQLRAAWSYLERYPEGAFHADVSQWFGRIEPLFYEASADSAQGMQRYLDALPRGPHAVPAAERRDALVAEGKSRAGEGLAKAAAAFEERLARAAQTREDVVSAYSSWVARLTAFDGWGRPLEPLSEPFASSWMADPAPACGRDVCSKIDAFSYELEREGNPETRVCTLEVAIRRSKGAVIEASVHGPDLFNRVFEAHTAKAVGPDDAGARAAAIAGVIELTSGAVARKLDPHRCEADAKPPAAMARQCDGIRLELIPSASANADDRVVIRWLGKL